MTWFDRLSLLGVTLVAAFLRLPGIDARGRFDADQGHDMLTLVAFTRDGIVPLLGPKTSVGEFHHGAFYYFLLAPAAGLSNGDPVAVTAFLALLGIGAVALTWWLGRAMGGPVAGVVAGALLAVSPAAIEESTFIWNPNPIGFFAALSLAAAWKARSGGSPGWWAIAIGAAGAVVQLHVLGVVFLLPMLVLGLLDVRRDRAVAAALLGGVGLIALLFAPLLAFEIQNGFLETRRVLAYLSGGDDPSTGGPILALAFTLLRVVGWPLVGLVTDVLAVAAILLAVTVGLAVLGLRVARGLEAVAMRWLVGILAWSTLALAFAAPSLQRVVTGLPNDHYHAFLDSVVVLLIAIPTGHLFSRASLAWRESRRPTALAAAVVIGVAIVALEVVALNRRPPKVDPDGGWPAMRAAGERIVDVANGAPVVLLGLPTFKLADGVGYPIELAGGSIVELADVPIGAEVVVVACDRLFESAIGNGCGGAAEDALIEALIGSRTEGSPTPRLIDRFDVYPGGRTSISIYGP